jgi:hypothetical protein
MESVVLSAPVFDREAFHRLTLQCEPLQRQLIAAFLRDVDAMRSDVLDTAGQGARAFADSIHRLRGASHFVAGERLARLLAHLEERSAFDSLQERATIALRVEAELSMLEAALRRGGWDAGDEA